MATKYYDERIGEWVICGTSQALEVNIVDVSDNYESNNVEGALREIATTVNEFEDTVSNIEAQNELLEEENATMMLALTELYETLGVSSISTRTFSNRYSVSNRSYNDYEVSTMESDVENEEEIEYFVSPMAKVYAKLIEKELKTLREVPPLLQEEVMYALENKK